MKTVKTILAFVGIIGLFFTPIETVPFWIPALWMLVSIVLILLSGILWEKVEKKETK